MQRPPKTLTVAYRIVTPMFIGDAEQHGTGINPGSVKGALRFWWRALNWGRIVQTESDEAAALKRLHSEEADLFGSAAKDAAGQARFLLQIKAPSVRKATLTKPRCGVQYLAGQGLYDSQQNRFLRQALACDEFELICRLRPGTGETTRLQLIDTLFAFGTLGSLGSRARKGFGSVAIQSLRQNETEQDVPRDKLSLLARIDGWKQPTGLPPFTAFSQKTRIDISLQSGEPMDLLETAGRGLLLYRSWGRKGMVCGEPSKRRFRFDHDLMEAVARGVPPTGIPERSVFGLPHNYYFSSNGSKVDFTLGEKERTQRSRRASPLFIHVHRFPDGSTLLLHLLFPARFLSPGDHLEFKPGRGRSQRLAFEDRMIDWSKIHSYMDRFPGREQIL